MEPSKQKKHKKIPATLKNIEQWQMSRRHFLKGLLITGTITQIPFLSACLNKNDKNEVLAFGQLNTKQRELMALVQEILFPKDGNGPSASEVNALDYLQWVISDPRMDPGEVEYIFNGIDWLNETAKEIFSELFLNLSQKKKEKIIANIANENWGEKWLSVLLTLIFEALLSDPQYGGNTDSVAWKWLEHYPGYPRPTEHLLYDKIFDEI